MRGRKIAILLLLVLPLNMAADLYAQDASDSPEKEYQIKAAFLYNFIKFVDWPKEKFLDVNEPVVIGIIGKDPFGNVFEPLKDRKVKNKAVLIERFRSFEDLKRVGQENQSAFEKQIANIRKCHLLFICSSEQNTREEIMNSVKNCNVLTVGESGDFLKAGGIINFIVEEKKVRFEVNLDNSEREKLKISSQLLKLAQRVIKQN